jgi:NAD(P)-dependent dehydrogenase (short-subunit alcohol dehydrogenase family)
VQVTDMSGRTVIVTGGNSGIGLETAAALAGAGARVIITARDSNRGAAAVEKIQARGGVGTVELSVFDLGRLASVREGASDLLGRTDRIDVLVNNAGLMLTDRTETADGFETTFGVNHLGPFLLTMLLLERIKESAPARIVNVSSTAHQSARRGLDFDDLQSTKSYAGMAVYGRTKLANIYFTTELTRRLAGTGVTVNALHPGTIRSGFGGDGDAGGFFGWGIKVARPFMAGPVKGAETSVYLASAPEVEGVTGQFFTKCKPTTPSKAARDDAAATRLWAVSEQMVGLVPA